MNYSILSYQVVKIHVVPMIDVVTFVGGLRSWDLKLFYIFEWFYVCRKV